MSDKVRYALLLGIKVAQEWKQDENPYGFVERGINMSYDAACYFEDRLKDALQQYDGMEGK